MTTAQPNGSCERSAPDSPFGDIALATGAARNAAPSNVSWPIAPSSTEIAPPNIIRPNCAPFNASLTPGPDTDIVTQGELGDAFYGVGSGRLDVIQDGQPVRQLVARGHFGAMAPLHEARHRRLRHRQRVEAGAYP